MIDIRPRLRVVESRFEAPAGPRHLNGSSRAGRIWRRLSYLPLALFVLVGVLSVLEGRGPAQDEAIYAAAGLRALDGHGVSDLYLTWFSGSLLWPTLSGAAYTLGGITASRLLAIGCVTAALWAISKAAENFFGPRARFWTVAVGTASVPVLALARLAVHDVLAVALLALALWAVTELGRTSHRRWLVISALAGGTAVLAKYPAALYLVPVLGLVILLRHRTWLFDATIFVFVVGAILLVYYLVYRQQLNQLIRFAGEYEIPTFGIDRRMIAANQLRFTAFPVLAALAGGWVARKEGLLPLILFSPVLLAPAYHLAVGVNPASLKHPVMGFTFALPLAGVAFAELWRRGVRMTAVALALAVAVIGVADVRLLTDGEPDHTDVATFLAPRVEQDDRLLVNNSWPLVLELYGQGVIRTPWQIYDVYRIEHGQNEVPLCEFDWLVEIPGGSRWPQSVRDEVDRCGFTEVYASEQTLVGFSTDLRFFLYPGPSTVQRRTSGDD